jgi:hypothetical protein
MITSARIFRMHHVLDFRIGNDKLCLAHQTGCPTHMVSVAGTHPGKDICATLDMKEIIDEEQTKSRKNET